MSAPTLTQTIEQLRAALIEYLESAYHIRDEGLLKQRRSLLEKWGVVAQVPFVEVLPQYRTEGDLFATGADASLPEGARKALKVLAQPGTGRHGVELQRRVFNPPYKHQLDAVQHALGTHRDHRGRRKSLVVTTGTGSGKTECFLLPMIAQLSQQAYEAGVHGTTAGRRRWAQRGVRALVLYPMNALVNDQLGRLRGWLGDERLVSLFLDDWKTGRPIRFGRYTGRATFPGLREHPKRDALGRILRSAQTGRIKWKSPSRQKLAFAPPVAEGRRDRVKTFETFFLDIQRKVLLAEEQLRNGATERDLDQELKPALHLYRDLHRLGKWPAKPDLGSYFLNEGYPDWWKRDNLPGPWWMKNNNEPNRLVTQLRDAEHYSRHETHDASPDVLVTNYSMLEYMLMRPLERGIFEQTAAYYRDNPGESLLLVVDEGHLYRGTTGAEVALLLRRLTQRLGLEPKRVQVILTSASFSTPRAASHFAAQLTGKSSTDFVPLQGAMVLSDQDAPVTMAELNALAAVDVGAFEAEREPAASAEHHRRRRALAVQPVLELAGAWSSDQNAKDDMIERFAVEPGALEEALHSALTPLASLQRLRFVAMPRQGAPEEREAKLDGQPTGPRPVSQRPPAGFPGAPLVELLKPDDSDCEFEAEKRERALTALLSLATAARDAKGNALLPARLHAFFRGLPGLWICTSRRCTALTEAERGGLAGKLYGHDPGTTCSCGGRVLPLFTCRDCGSAYLRAYTPATSEQLKERGAEAAAATGGGYLWGEPGEPREADGSPGPPLEPLDLYLPRTSADVAKAGAVAQPLELDPLTGRLSCVPGSLRRRVFGKRERTFVFGARGASEDLDHAARDKRLRNGQHASCACCGAKGTRSSTVMDHVTKGSQPLAALIAAQLQAQPARDKGDSGAARERRLRFAPLQGRKTLVFSDSRQKAAQLSTFLNSYAARDAARSLLLLGWQWLEGIPGIEGELCLRHVRHALLVGETLTGRPLRVPASAGEQEGEGNLDSARAAAQRLVSLERPKAKNVWRFLGSDAPLVEAWAALPYAAATGTWLKVAPDGAARPGSSRVSALNRASTLASLALGQLRPADEVQDEVRDCVREQLRSLPTGATSGTVEPSNASCDALVARWLWIVASAHGVNCKTLRFDTWVGDQGAVKPVKTLKSGKNRLRDRLEAALKPLSSARVKAVHQGLKRLLTTTEGFLCGDKVTLWIPDPLVPTLETGEPAWAMCSTCGTIGPHVPILAQDTDGTTHCAQCGTEAASPLPLVLDEISRQLKHPGAETDDAVVRRQEWFRRRKGHLRQPAIDLLLAGIKPIVPVAAEHTAQVGDAPRGEAFSPAELHELLFQDVYVGTDHRGKKRPAVDVLSATTTMEVGIDIGSLSGVALRNMPPRRDNYQQRSGRAGRRGDGVATVIAWANTGGHDIHAFERPQVVLTDPIDDPRLALGNEQVARRHAAAALVQAYAHEQLAEADPLHSPQLFEVLGSIDSFLDPSAMVCLDGLERFGARLAEDTAKTRRLLRFAASGMEEEQRSAFLGRPGDAPLPRRLTERVRAAVTDENRRRGSGALNGQVLAMRLLQMTGGRVRPLLRFFGKGSTPAPETDWLELKATIVPSKDSPHRLAKSRDSDYRWHVAKALVSLRNTSGGVLVVGVDDRSGAAVPDAVPNNVDQWWRNTRGPLLGPGESWSEWSPRAKNRPRARLSLTADSTLQGAVTLGIGDLDGQRVALLFVAPATNEVELVRVRREDGRTLVYARALGAVGQDQRMATEVDEEAVVRQLGDRPLHLTTAFSAFEKWWSVAVHTFPPPTGVQVVRPEDGSGEDSGANEERGRLSAAEQADNSTFSQTEEATDTMGSTEGRDNAADTSAEHTASLGREAGASRPAGRLRSERDSLLRLLIDEGVLPSYAFPTEVTALHILDKDDRDTAAERQRALYTVSQGLEQALSQYAPGREVYVDNQRWHVGAIFDRSYRQKERRAAYQAARVYLYCSACGHYTEQVDGEALTKDDIGVVGVDDAAKVLKKKPCPICDAEVPVRLWFRPTGFLHVDPDRETGTKEALAYPTPARLVAPKPPDNEPNVSRHVPSAWGNRVRVTAGWRAELVHLNLGASDSGYAYCTGCGRIESLRATPSSSWRTQSPHDYPHNAPKEAGQALKCTGRVATIGRTLGHSLKTDVCLLQLEVGAAGVPLRSTSPEAKAALESLTQTILIAGAERVLRLGRGELGAGHRWPKGGDEQDQLVDIYLYDRVPGGAGYSDELGARGSGDPRSPSTVRLLAEACLLLDCSCTASCYSCLRRYENQRDHSLLDRTLAKYVLQALLHGKPPADWLLAGSTERLLLAARALAAQLRAEGRTAEVVSDGLPSGLVSVSWTKQAGEGGSALLVLERPLAHDDLEELDRVAGAAARDYLEDLDDDAWHLVSAFRIGHDLPGVVQELVSLACL